MMPLVVSRDCERRQWHCYSYCYCFLCHCALFWWRYSSQSDYRYRIHRARRRLDKSVLSPSFLYKVNQNNEIEADQLELNSQKQLSVKLRCDASMLTYECHNNEDDRIICTAVVGYLKETCQAFSSDIFNLYVKNICYRRQRLFVSLLSVSR